MEISAANKHAKLIRSLGKKKYRNETGLFLAEGYRFVSEVPKETAIDFYALATGFEEKHPAFPFREGIPRYTFAERAFTALSETQNPQGVLAVCRKHTVPLAAIADAAGDALILVLDGIKDPGNLGTIVRTADAAGLDGLVLTNNTVDIYNPKVLRATMGSIFRLPIAIAMDAATSLTQLKQAGFELLGTSPAAAHTHFEAQYRGRKAIIIGSEADGMSQETAALCDCLLKIPILGGAESLNAAVAASVMMYEAVRQRMCAD